MRVHGFQGSRLEERFERKLEAAEHVAAQAERPHAAKRAGMKVRGVDVGQRLGISTADLALLVRSGNPEMASGRALRETPTELWLRSLLLGEQRLRA